MERRRSILSTGSQVTTRTSDLDYKLQLPKNCSYSKVNKQQVLKPFQSILILEATLSRLDSAEMSCPNVWCLSVAPVRKVCKGRRGEERGEGGRREGKGAEEKSGEE